jgi:ABC-type polysaccharide/polyol phosphate export permease
VKAIEGTQAYAAAIWRCRYFWMSLVKMDLRTRYRRSVLGIGWSLLHPIAMTIVLCTVFHKLFNLDIREYGPFLLSGLTFWGFLTTSITHGCECFFMGETYIRQYPAPVAIYPLRTVLGGAVHFGLALIVVLLLTWAMRGFSNLDALVSLVPTLMLLMVLGWSLAVLAGFANVFFPDMKHLMEIGLQLLFYATPVMYPPALLADRGMAWMVEYNPVAAILGLIRQPILDGHFPQAGTWAVALATVLSAAAAALFTLVKLQRRLIFHL